MVAATRRALPKGTKVGHAGTLDPFATGLLLVLVGRATRAQRWFMELPKTYRAVARLGWRSDTGDPDGRLERTGNVPAELELPTGELMQRPPAYSAVKVEGERLYRKARRGEAAEAAPRPISVYRFELLWREGDRAGLEIECSSGTYVRQLVADLGDAYCEELERTAIGPFRLEDADSERLVPLSEALAFLPERVLTAEEAADVGHGRSLSLGSESGATRLTHEGELLAIGTFDGVHVGHRAVIGGNDTVLTFDPHPLAVLHPEALPKLVNSFEIKRDLIAGLGVDELVVIPFDRDFASLSADEFIEQVLIDRLGATRVSVGENFRFGKKAQGDPELLRSRDEFETRVVPLIECDGETVSSSHIRGLVAAGEVDKAARFLGGPFLLEGEVVGGDRRGRDLGIPTANIVPDDRLVCPGHGVYAAWAHGHQAAVNVGIRPMFETGRGLLVEAHLIDFEGDLYGETLRIAFVERMRGERRFDSAEALVEQMNRDVERAKEICETTRYEVA